MARKIRSYNLENRTQRLKMPVAKKPVYVRIGHGISLGYRRNKTAGSWVLKITVSRNVAPIRVIGSADDFDDADGVNFLTFWQAQEKAKFEAKSTNSIQMQEPLNILKATENYLEILKAKNPRTAADCSGRLNKHFLPKFGHVLVSEITKTALDSWLANLISKENDAESIRRSKDSANRVLSMVKALLNHATKDESNRIIDDSAWRFVKPFQSVSKAREIRYTDEEINKLIKSAPNHAISELIKGAYLTGARYGELIELRLEHLDLNTKTLNLVIGKTGARTIILQNSAVKFFQQLALNRNQEDYLFLKEDQTKWKRSDQTRPMKAALKAAGLSQNGSIYALRHTYISKAIEGLVPLNIIAENCGTSIRLIEKTYSKILAQSRRNFIENGAPTLDI